MWRHVTRYSRWLRGRRIPRTPLLFNPDWYLARNTDVAAEGIDPWRHYVLHGAAENRDPNPVFDTQWYLSRYPDVRASGMNPLHHYCEYGAALGFEPNVLFDSAWYARQNNLGSDALGLEPVLHYLQQGAARQCDPSPRFDTAWYLRSNPELRTDALTPLGDYLQYGRREGRTARPCETRAEVAPTPETDRCNGRIAIYTAIVGDYDCLKVPAVVDPRCDYFCFTDRDISWQNVWVRRDLDWRHDDDTRTARYVKLHAHKYFPEYESSIWLDANLRLMCTAQALMPSASDWEVVLWHHPYRDCVYAEGETCIRQNKDDPAVIAAQLQRYRAAGFPERAGLAETSVLVRRHNEPGIVKFAHRWWEECVRGSRRDQLSFPLAACQENVRVGYLGPRQSNMRNDPRLRFFMHAQRRASW